MFYNKHNIKIYNVTLNVQFSYMFKENTNLENFFKFNKDNLPDLVVVSI